jgi:hypothetical protein
MPLHDSRKPTGESGIRGLSWCQPIGASAWLAARTPAFIQLALCRLGGRPWVSFDFCVRRLAIARGIQFSLHLLPFVECHGGLALRRRDGGAHDRARILRRFAC